MPTIASIYRYPVKGLGPDRLDSADLEPGRTIAADRLYAIENGPSGFDPAHAAYLPKNRFLMLMRNERLAALRTSLRRNDPYARCRRERARGCLRRPAHDRRPRRDRAVLRRVLCR